MRGEFTLINRKEYNKQWSKQWRLDHKEEKAEKNKQWRFDHPEYHKQWHLDHPGYHKQWYREHKEISLEYQKKYRQEYKEEQVEYYRNKRKTNLKYNLNNNISGLIRKSLKGNKAGRHWETLVGYTLADLIKILQKTMPEGYTWNDYLNGKLHIDHRIPISVYNFTSPNHIDFLKCWSLENLQLLPAKENLIKHDKLSKPFQPSLKLSCKL